MIDRMPGTTRMVLAYIRKEAKLLIAGVGKAYLRETTWTLEDHPLVENWPMLERQAPASKPDSGVAA